jgi:hypothetical protein
LHDPRLAFSSIRREFTNLQERSPARVSGTHFRLGLQVSPEDALRLCPMTQQYGDENSWLIKRSHKSNRRVSEFVCITPAEGLGRRFLSISRIAGKTLSKQFGGDSGPLGKILSALAENKPADRWLELLWIITEERGNTEWLPLASDDFSNFAFIDDAIQGSLDVLDVLASKHTEIDDGTPCTPTIQRDPVNPRYVNVFGRSLYLGSNTQISRLFELLSQPFGKSRSFAEVQYAVDEMASDEHDDVVERKRTQGRVRKAVHELRCRLRTAMLDEFIVIERTDLERVPRVTMHRIDASHLK